MDKVVCIAFIMYHSSEKAIIKNYALQLLNGDISLREANKHPLFHEQLVLAEAIYKKKALDRHKVQAFAEKYLLMEV